MATKKSSKSTKTKTAKTTRSARPAVDHSHIGKCFVAFGLIITALLFGFFYLLGQRKTYTETQEIKAFRDVADAYIQEHFAIPEERTAEITGYGITKDNDLYADFEIIKYVNHVALSKQPARLHFQCHDENNQPKEHCSFAYWYGEETAIKTNK